MGLLKRAALFGLSFLGALVVLDIYLQIAEIQTPMETRIDPELGPTYIPNKWITRFNEGFFMGAVNAYGYMGPAYSPRRTGAEIRIILIGDSFVLGHTVLPRQYFGRYLEKRLKGLIGKDVQVMNFGKADFNVGNMYQYFHDFANRFDHDLSLFFVGEGDLAPTGQVASGLYPTVRLDGGRIVIDKSFRTTAAYRIYKSVEPLLIRSSVLRLVFNTYKIIDSENWRFVLLDKLVTWAAPRSPEKPASMQRRTPIALSLTNRAVIRELARDPKNILVIQTPLDPGLRSEIEATGIPIIDLAAYLERLRTGGMDPYYWPVTGMSGHWNHASQSLIGEFLAERIFERDFP